jgi:AraC-like DNA-binding protein
MNMSRVSLYKKILLITGKTPVEFIRFIRLEKAKHLLETSQLNISEICYKVGFNTPKYFTKAFKAEYNVLPSEYMNELNKAEGK